MSNYNLYQAKMKKTILIFVIILINTKVYSQTITDFFQELPDSAILNLSKEERKKIVNYSADNKSHEDAINDLKNNQISYAFSFIDVKNGYLKLVGAFEGHIQICYWNLKNGNKLIAVYQEGCGPVCDVVRFNFFNYNNKKISPVSLKSVIPEIEQDFFKEKYNENTEKMNKDDIVAVLLFDLPKNGKNISAKWGNEDSKETYLKYGIIGNRMDLIWNDGKFRKGKVYWDE